MKPKISRTKLNTIPSAQCGPLGEPGLTVTMTSVAKTEDKGSPQNAV